MIPERRSAEVTPAVCKASAGAVEHLPVARVRNLADFLADAKAAGCWCYGAAAGAKTPTRRRTTPAGSCWCSARRARGCGRGSRPPATTLVALPLRGRVESLNVSATAAVLLYDDLAVPA